MDGSCYLNDTRKISFFLFASDYEGIPENLVLNLFVFLILLILFSLLRKKAGDYGRMAIVSPNEQRFLISTTSGYNIWTSLFFGEAEQHVGKKKEVKSLKPLHSRLDEGYCTWLSAIYRLRDEQISSRCGADAMDYLSFQRHIIAYLCTLCVVCVAIILPVNFQGNLEGTKKQFGHTTISNLDPLSPLLWVHIIFAALFIPITIFFMRRFSLYLTSNTLETSPNILMILNIPKQHCQVELIQEHFKEAFPEVVVDEIEFAYRINKLIEIDWQKRIVENAKMYYERQVAETNTVSMMRPYRCSNLCWCICCDACGCKEVDALEYYTREELNLFHASKDAKIKALQSPLGIAFITLEHPRMANDIYQNFKLNILSETIPRTSRVSTTLAVDNWQVRYAPLPEDIIWENLDSTEDKWWIRAVCINVLVFLFLFFLTTPSIILTNLDSIYFDTTFQMNTLLSESLPVILLTVFKSILPLIVYQSEEYIGHWTKSSRNYAVMRKTFIFMLFMLLILPSLGLASAKAFVEWAFKTKEDIAFRWKCLFLPDKGAFFVNLVISSALIGNALDLIRFSDLFMYFLRYSCIKSPAEKEGVKKQILQEYQYSIQYTYMLIIVAIVVVYSISCPLIVPFGILYMVIKHFVDRYNIYFAYAPAKIHKNIHGTAINYVIFTVLLLQLILLLFSILRQGYESPVTYFLAAVVFFSFGTYLAQLIFGCCKGFSPIMYRDYDVYSSGDGHTAVSMDASNTHPFTPNILSEEHFRFETTDKSYGSQSETHIPKDVSNSSVSTDTTSY